MGLISENHPGITDEKQAGLAAAALSSSSLGLFKSVTASIAVKKTKKMMK